MATIALAQGSVFTALTNLFKKFANKLDATSVPHWMEYLNDKS